MSKALIVIDKLNMGGVTSSLINYIHYASKYFDTVDLLCFNPENAKNFSFPKNVNLLKEPKVLHVLGKTQNEIKSESKMLFLLRALLVFLSRCISGRFARKILNLFVKKIGYYDLSISYCHDVAWKSLTTGCNDFVINKTKAHKKISFVHCDYSKFGGYNKRQEAIYDKFDKIICVSQSCCDSFALMFPRLSSKTFACENFIEVFKDSSKPIKYDSSKTNFVTVCRISNEKGLDRVISACKNISFVEKDFLWTVVGDGPFLDCYKSEVSKLGLEKYIKFVGKSSNPSIFIKDSDFFLLPSYHEAAPMVFGECRMLGVPVVTTKTSSAEELVASRNLGIVCENDEKDIERVLLDLIQKKIDLPIVSKEMIDNTNLNAMKQFKNLIGELGISIIK